MQKFTTAQLQESLINLHAIHFEGFAFVGGEIEEFGMIFNEVLRRMGDEAFDAWTDSLGW